MNVWNELWPYRRLIQQLAARDLKARYKVSVLGFFWSLLRPLLTIAVLAVVFSLLLGLKSASYNVSFPLLIVASYIPWFFFSTAILEGTQSLLGNAHLIKKVYCPRAVFPTSVVMANLVNFLFSFLVLLPAIYILTHATPSFALLQLPFVILTNTAFLLGLCYITSALNVLYRDMTQITEFVVFVWFYLSPVLYDVNEAFTQIPEKAPWLYWPYFLNPMVGLMEWYRYTFFASEFNGNPQYVSTIFYQAIPYTIALSLLVLLAGYHILKKLETRAVDEL